MGTKLNCSQVHNSAHLCMDKTNSASMYLHILGEWKSFMLSSLHPMQASEIIRFELDEKKLSELLTQVEDVEKAIEKYAHA